MRCRDIVFSEQPQFSVVIIVGDICSRISLGELSYLLLSARSDTDRVLRYLAMIKLSRCIALRKTVQNGTCESAAANESKMVCFVGGLDEVHRKSM